ncbi:hypothetical protein V3595_01245 [Bacillus sp. CFBP9009]
MNPILNEVKLVCYFERTQEVISLRAIETTIGMEILGDTENNYSSVGNLQRHPGSSIVEKGCKCI